ncbi:hypothetical protein B0H16DRAFT_868341 [Mycena metata]|uniref:F-box domain-containing protein n=1 Tax=Mycena metata TaxID=1033252 RepID=A0AAD7N8D8_9AGAR|nr:hypothetical protein B0H16DRAFT_868341 [Mycena metata]
MERLEFWTSTEIAPFVRICDVRPYPPSHPSHPDCCRTDEPYILLFSFFERVVRFTNLRLLSFIGVHFTQTFLTNLCRLPELTTLSVTNYAAALGHDIDFSQVKFQNLLELSLHDRIPGEGTDHSHWLRLLRPEFLTRLSIRLHSSHISEIDRRPSFPHVTKLTLTLATSSQTPDIRRFLSKFPALRILEIRDRKGEREPADSVEPTTVFFSPAHGIHWARVDTEHIPSSTHPHSSYHRALPGNTCSLHDAQDNRSAKSYHLLAGPGAHTLEHAARCHMRGFPRSHKTTR